MNIMSSVAAIMGMILGTAGFVMSILNYLRDRPCVHVYQEWDNSNPAATEPFVIIHVRNVGRRPIFIMFAGLELPVSGSNRYLKAPFDATNEGKRLGEGDAPLVIALNYPPELKAYSDRWRAVRAFASDTSGRVYRAKKQARGLPAPSWASTSKILS
jgi:hypothetical protein